MSDGLFPLALVETDDREGSPEHRHVLMPNMAYACGGSILTKRGGFTVGTSLWQRVTCPVCRGLGRAFLATECKRQQGNQERVAL